MTHITPQVNGTVAPLTNVALFSAMMADLVRAPTHLPHMGCLHGWSGYGKTWSARYAANKHRAFYVEAGESWTRRRFLKALLGALGIEARGAADDMVEQAIEALRGYRRPLIIDEADYIVKRGYIETIRELHDKAFVPIALIGEDKLLAEIKRVSERTHRRILLATEAQPSSAEDARVVARLYHPDLEYSDDLLAAVLDASGGRLGYIVVNLYNISVEAQVQGWPRIDRALWGDRAFYAGTNPHRRRG